ncbi:chemotaxis response regulator protein-glutamate methylesterase [Nitrosopumilus zosterae]|uniref:Protein-glutamate methylesterase/protein-glutamine glutaminase n=1 Tax=Nitrosopumilus zosterae TaxID=718286 RepID=A0A2S2KQN3_9ARCH|nr:chemotaxis-specific protein-glutamate methyltransferase CheB [Nitrosopumilus zosterae]BDQ30642.1 chemotaxis-specific protein-glutamate methyltransferase CheB [Nitrosopumilus zosterae]GBH33924.1 chemotaxis response regulator protein-glutamate methylesterase [Nitrosopumilus zosterae]
MLKEETIPISVGIVNDSNLMRKYISDLINVDEIEIKWTAVNGEDALAKISKRKPDVILLDLEMPTMDGMTFIENMEKMKMMIPTIIVSSFSQDGSKVVLDALENGAVDFVTIPLKDIDDKKLQEELLTKIKISAKSDPIQLITEKIYSLKPSKKIFTKSNSSERLIVIGSSTGGPGMVQKVLSKLPANIAAGILVVQHMPKEFTKQFANRLSEKTGFIVREANEGDEIRDHEILVAPGDYHMIVLPNRRIHLDSSEKRFGVRPSVNMTMVSAAEVYGSNVIGVVLTGMGHDGGFGMKTIKKRGGHTIVQNKETCVIFGMPKAVIDLDAADHVVGINEIPIKIYEEMQNLV